MLTATALLRRHGVVNKFVAFTGPGVSRLSLPDRATIANMAPEYGAGLFPVDAETLRYLRGTSRDEARVLLVERYAKEQGLFRTDEAPEPLFSESLELDLSTVEASLAGPRRPHDRMPLRDVVRTFRTAFAEQFFGSLELDKSRSRAERRACGHWPDCGDLRDHKLHEHVQPFGDDQRRTSSKEGSGARASG